MNDEIRKLQDRKTELINKIARILKSKGINVDIKKIEIYADNADNAGQIMDAFEEAGAFDREFEHYGDAIEYIREKDPSLVWSLQLARREGYSFDDLDTAKLASLLAKSETRKKFYEVEIDIDRILEKVEEVNKEIRKLKMKINKIDDIAL